MSFAYEHGQIEPSIEKKWTMQTHISCCYRTRTDSDVTISLSSYSSDSDQVSLT